MVEPEYARDPDDARSRHDLDRILRKVAFMIVDNQPEEAIKLAQRAQSLSERHLKLTPNNPEYVRAQADAFLIIGYGLQKLERWREAVGVNLDATFYCMKYEIPAMLVNGGGAIVNISSQSGIKGQVRQAAYAAAKGGVIALTKTAAAEYATRGLRVNSVAPGGIETPGIAAYFEANPEVREGTLAVHAMRRLGQPREIADAVAWLCSDRASFVTGDVLLVDGGVGVNAHDA